MSERLHPRRARGFSLLEVIVALVVMTLVSMVVLGALGPWLGLKQSIDNDRKLQDLQQGLSAYYRDNAMAVEADTTATLGVFVHEAPGAAGGCVGQADAFRATQVYFSDGQAAVTDGFKSPVCIFVSLPQSRSVDGNLLYFRTLAALSGGPNGIIEPGTLFNQNTGELVLDGDDRAVFVNGYEIQLALYRETMARMERLARLYETYFTSRFLSSTDRDITRYYFAADGATPGYDVPVAGVTVAPSGGSWSPATSVLGAMGVSPEQLTSAWEADNAIEVASRNEAALNGVRVKTPASTGIGVLPYTAVLRARLPGAVPSYALKVAVGNY